jgi:cysteine desulfurase
MAEIYLDNHTGTPLCSAALEKLSNQASGKIDTRPLYDLCGAQSNDVFVFTSSGAEAINQVFWSVFLEKARKEGKCHIIISCIEDAPTMQCAKRLEELGCFIKIIPVTPNGQIDLERLKEAINPRTALISVTMAHGLTGVIQPVEEIAAVAKEKKILLHFDATYAVGKYPFSFEGDYLTFSGDRIHAAKNTGALFAKEGAPLVPFILGGTGLRGGALDQASLASLAAAAHHASLYLDSMCVETARLRDSFENQLQGKALFTDTLRLPNTTVVRFSRVHQEALLYFLHRKELYATIGGSYAQYLSRVLTASNVPDAESAISFALSRMNTERELNDAAALINRVVSELQHIAGPA